MDALAHQEGQFVGVLARGWHSNNTLWNNKKVGQSKLCSGTVTLTCSLNNPTTTQKQLLGLITYNHQ